MKPPTVKQIHNGTIRVCCDLFFGELRARSPLTHSIYHRLDEQVTWTPPEGNSNVLTYLLERNDQQRLADNGFEVRSRAREAVLCRQQICDSVLSVVPVALTPDAFSRDRFG